MSGLYIMNYISLEFFMKKLFSIFLILLLFNVQDVNAQEILSEFKNDIVKSIIENKITVQDGSSILIDDIKIQNYISNVGLKILNANKIDKRMTFVFHRKDAKIKGEPSLTRRQIIIYKNDIKFVADDAELAAYLSREIAKGVESYDGIWNGVVSSAQMKLAPKKFEIFFDKRAVDYMVTAGYNPLALITFMNKSYEQKRFDKISNHNLTSKRLAYIYEYIYTKYPYFLADNEYIKNESYQNFLLNSIENRKKLHEKIKAGSKERINYE